jgi:hypothetical protein
MKNQESSNLELKKEEGVRLTAEQKSNNPGENGGFWSGFLKQSTNQLVEFLNKGGDIYERENMKKIREEEKEDLKLKKSVTDYIKKLLDDVPKGLKNFISEEEMLLRALSRYKEQYGFADGSEMEIEYRKLQEKAEKKESLILEKEKSAQKSEREAQITEIEKGLAGEDWNSVSGYINFHLKNIPGLDSTEYAALRDTLLGKFNEMQQKEY